MRPRLRAGGLGENQCFQTPTPKRLDTTLILLPVLLPPHPTQRRWRSALQGPPWSGDGRASPALLRGRGVILASDSARGLHPEQRTRGAALPAAGGPARLLPGRLGPGPPPQPESPRYPSHRPARVSAPARPAGQALGLGSPKTREARVCHCAGIRLPWSRRGHTLETGVSVLKADRRGIPPPVIRRACRILHHHPPLVLRLLPR